MNSVAPKISAMKFQIKRMRQFLDHMTTVKIFEKLLILLVFSADLKEIQCFVQRWQHFILFICFLEMKFMTYLDKIMMMSLWNMLWAQTLFMVCKID